MWRGVTLSRHRRSAQIHLKFYEKKKWEQKIEYRFVWFYRLLWNNNKEYCFQNSVFHRNQQINNGGGGGRWVLKMLLETKIKLVGPFLRSNFGWERGKIQFACVFVKLCIIFLYNKEIVRCSNNTIFFFWLILFLFS